MTPLAVTDRLFFERAETGFDRAASRAHGRPRAGPQRRWRAVPRISGERDDCTRGRPDPQRRVRHRSRASASEPWRTKRRVTPMPASSRTRRSSAPPRASRRSRRVIRGPMPSRPGATNARLYSDANPLAAMDFSARTEAAWPRSTLMRGARIRASSRSWPRSAASGRPCRSCVPTVTRVADLRPLVRLNVAVVVESGGRRETGSYGTGGRFGYDRVAGEDVWRGAVEEALRQALVNLDSRPAPAGRDGGRARARAGRASCCTRRSGMGSRAISTARRPRPSPDCWVSGSPPRA